jgi:hypothetical protein
VWFAKKCRSPSGSPPEWVEITERLDRIERALSAGLPHDDQKTA